jgi:hypothetical protein
MGFLDKVKAQAEQAVKQGQDMLEDAQAKKKADGLLRDLGAWHYATETGRDDGKGQAEMARITGELHAHEALYGPLGAKEEAPPPPEASAPPPPPSAPPPPPSTTPPPPPSAPAPPVSSPPAPVNSPPPPVGTPPPPAGGPPSPGAPPAGGGL